jgi:ParB-like chromosome segregation protein Spo0J
MGIEKIKIDTIKVKEGGKPVDKNEVEVLAESMRNGLQINAILVNLNHELISGEHRLEAAKLLGWTEIEANIQDITEERAEIAKIEENLIRKHLNFVEVGELALKRDEYLEKEGLKAKSGDNQYTGGESDSPPKTTEELAMSASVSKRVYQQYKQLAKYLTPEEKERFKFGCITKNEALDRARQNKIILDNAARRQEISEQKTPKQETHKKTKQKNNDITIIPYGKADVREVLEKSSEEKKYSCIVYHVTKDNPINTHILLAKKEAAIFIWISGDMIKDTLDKFRYGYFSFNDILVWDKGNDLCEFCLVGFNGNDETWSKFINDNTLIFPYIMREPETQVGKKPEAFYNFINGIESKIEYFPSEKREGYDVYSDVKEDEGIHIDIPYGITHIEKNAFDNVSLTSVTIPESVTHIGDYAFRNNKLTSIIIPNSVIHIGKCAFDDNLLTSVIIPNSVKKIGNAAFYGNQLTSISIPDNIRKIGYNTFANNKLTNVKIGNKVATIERCAFIGNAITSVDIPASLNYIADNAFDMDKLGKKSKQRIMPIVEKTKDFEFQKTYDTVNMLIIKKDYDMTEFKNIMETIHLEHLFVDGILYVETYRLGRLKKEEQNVFYEFFDKNIEEMRDEEREIELYLNNNISDGYLTELGYIPRENFDKLVNKPKKLRLAEYEQIINANKPSEQPKAA